MRIGFDFGEKEKEEIEKAIKSAIMMNLSHGDKLIFGQVPGEFDEWQVRLEKKPKHEWHMMPELPKVGQTVMIFMAKYDIMAKAVLCKRRSRPRWYFRTSPKDGQPLNFDLNEVTMWKELDPDQKFPEDMGR